MFPISSGPGICDALSQADRLSLMSDNPDHISVHPSGRIPLAYGVLFLIALGIKSWLTWDWEYFELSYRSLLLLGVVVVGYQYLSRITSVYSITPLEISLSVGILSKRRRAAPLNRITNFEIDRPFLLRIFGLADLNVDTAGGAEIELELHDMNLSDAEAFSRFLNWHIGQQKVSDADENPQLRRARQAAVSALSKPPERNDSPESESNVAADSHSG